MSGLSLGNGVREQGARALGPLLKAVDNVTLTELDLEHAELGDSGKVLLVGALLDKSLKAFTCSCGVGPTSKRWCVRSDTTDLDLSGAGMSSTDAMLLAAAIKGHR